MIDALAALLFPKLASGLARALLIGLALAAAIAAFLAARAIHDRNLIAGHDAARAAATAKADRTADAHAAETRRADDNRLGNEATELGKAQANAPTDLDRRLARARCIRLQQAARAGGGEPPACR
jgi:uncharacterized protein YfaS (alpha-2-macroglobulin family)